MDRQRRDGASALSIAAALGHLEAVDCLLTRQASVDLPADLQVTPLLLASREGHHQVVKRLLKARAEVERAADMGATALSTCGPRAASVGKAFEQHRGLI